LVGLQGGKKARNRSFPKEDGGFEKNYELRKTLRVCQKGEGPEDELVIIGEVWQNETLANGVSHSGVQRGTGDQERGGKTPNVTKMENLKQRKQGVGKGQLDPGLADQKTGRAFEGGRNGQLELLNG